MATVTVRGLDERTRRALKRRAAAHGRSMEAEARDILTAAVSDTRLGATWVAATEHLRGEELPIPARSQPRDLDLA